MRKQVLAEVRVKVDLYNVEVDSDDYDALAEAVQKKVNELLVLLDYRGGRTGDEGYVSVEAVTDAMEY